jgi:citryl-CoA lyase
MILEAKTVAVDNRPNAYWTTRVSFVEDADVFVRGYSLAELIGRLSFPAATFLLVRGQLPSPGQANMMDAILCAILDYALYKPGTVAARYCASANPQMVPALATAILAVGEYTLAPDDAGRFIIDTFSRLQESDSAPDRFAHELVSQLTQRKQRVPGFGHPVFKYVDPRAQRLKEIAKQNGVWGEMGAWYEEVHRAFATLPGRATIPINDVGMLAAIMADMGFSPQEMTGIAIMSSLPGDIAHISEELQQSVRIRIVPDSIADYPDRSKANFVEDMRSKGWPT